MSNLRFQEPDGTFANPEVILVPSESISTDGNTIDLSSPKVYRALLMQSGTAAPVAIVLENTLGGTVVWTRSDVGLYTGTLDNTFTETKTWISQVNVPVNLDGETTFNIAESFWVDVSHIKVQTANIDVVGGSQTNADDCLANSSIEIRVYQG